MLIFSIIVALIIGFVIAACIMAPELADHEACKPINGEPLDTPGIGDTPGGDDEHPRRHIDIAA